MASSSSEDNINKSINEIGQFSYELKLPNSTTHRLLIWQFVTQRIFEKPFLGWGVNTARQIPGGGEKYTLKVDTPNNKKIVLFRESFLPLHPHNASLQIWLELGAVGAIIIAVFGWIFIRKLEDDDTDPVLFGVVISILAFNFISFGYHCTKFPTIEWNTIFTYYIPIIKNWTYRRRFN